MRARVYSAETTPLFMRIALEIFVGCFRVLIAW